MAQLVRDILRSLEALAPPALAESWDNIGLLVGDPWQPVEVAMVALDCSERVLEQATVAGANLLIVHHPLLFSATKRLVEDDGVISLARRLIREDCSLIAMHTNLDAAPRGLNDYLARLFELQQPRPLIPAEAKPLLKLVVYVPEDHVDAVREAICGAGAGHIGQYDLCTFGTPGTGTFRPLAGTSPYIGETGRLERVAEVRLETVVPKGALRGVLDALFATHPYEEVAYDLFALENTWPGAGLGRIGALETPITAGDFLDVVRHRLHTHRLNLVGDREREIRTVAVLGGGGGDFVADAQRSGADLYLTGELKHHQALQARQAGMLVIEAGHYATEHPVVHLLDEYLRGIIPELTVFIADEEDPLQRG